MYYVDIFSASSGGKEELITYRRSFDCFGIPKKRNKNVIIILTLFQAEI